MASVDGGFLDHSVSEKLRKKLPLCLDYLDCSEKFRALLGSKEVLTKFEIEDIQAEKVRHRQVSMLINFLQKKSMKHFHSFLRCLQKTDQGRVIMELGYDENDYDSDKTRIAIRELTKCCSCKRSSGKGYLTMCCSKYMILCDICQSKQSRDQRCTICAADMSSEGSPYKDEEMSILTDKLSKILESGEKCVNCDTHLPPFNHYCQKCQGHLCLKCVEGHSVLKCHKELQHLHLYNVCCRDGNKTKVYCQECQLYSCSGCVKDCRQHRDKITDDIKTNIYKEVSQKIKLREGEDEKHVEKMKEMERSWRVRELRIHVQGSAAGKREEGRRWKEETMNLITKYRTQVERGCLTGEGRRFIDDLHEATTQTRGRLFMKFMRVQVQTEKNNDSKIQTKTSPEPGPTQGRSYAGSNPPLEISQKRKRRKRKRKGKKIRG